MLMSSSIKSGGLFNLTYARWRVRVEGLDALNHLGDPETWGKTGDL
jgi:hypothetical protein